MSSTLADDVLVASATAALADDKIVNITRKGSDQWIQIEQIKITEYGMVIATDARQRGSVLMLPPGELGGVWERPREG